MSKWDDLNNEARGEGSLIATLVTAGVCLIGKMFIDNIDKSKRDKITDLNNQISGVDQNINSEMQKGFFFRDNSKINSLQQEKQTLINQRDSMTNKNKK